MAARGCCYLFQPGASGLIGRVVGARAGATRTPAEEEPGSGDDVRKFVKQATMQAFDSTLISASLKMDNLLQMRTWVEIRISTAIDQIVETLDIGIGKEGETTILCHRAGQRFEPMTGRWPIRRQPRQLKTSMSETSRHRVDSNPRGNLYTRIVRFKIHFSCAVSSFGSRPNLD